MYVKLYVCDPNHVLEHLNVITHIEAGTLLASLDVSSLYTNIPNDEGLEACLLFLE